MPMFAGDAAGPIADRFRDLLIAQRRFYVLGMSSSSTSMTVRRSSGCGNMLPLFVITENSADGRVGVRNQTVRSPLTEQPVFERSEPASHWRQKRAARQDCRRPVQGGDFQLR